MYIHYLYMCRYIYVCMHIHVCVSVHIKSHVTNLDVEFKAGIVWTQADRDPGVCRLSLSPSAPCPPFLRSSTRCLLVGTGCHCGSGCHIHTPPSRRRQGGLENSFAVGTVPVLQKGTKERGPLSKSFCNSPRRPRLSTGFLITFV